MTRMGERACENTVKAMGVKGELSIMSVSMFNSLNKLNGSNHGPYGMRARWANAEFKKIQCTYKHANHTNTAGMSFMLTHFG